MAVACGGGAAGGRDDAPACRRSRRGIERAVTGRHVDVRGGLSLRPRALAGLNCQHCTLARILVVVSSYCAKRRGTQTAGFWIHRQKGRGMMGRARSPRGYAWLRARGLAVALGGFNDRRARVCRPRGAARCEASGYGDKGRVKRAAWWHNVMAPLLAASREAGARSPRRSAPPPPAFSRPVARPCPEPSPQSQSTSCRHP
mmetsp:Transcript_461/g.1558  ORF Transcript_461/g.1558 Transcript_461/m.1558 type:complete len:201 (+) Transcript_461:831-1433(+)